jgi:O-antigen/teichoic acid export membrane protein
MGAVGPVILPLVSRAHREGRPLGPVVSKALAMLCGVGWPFFALIAVLADPLIYLLFGAQWAEAVGPARWLALSAAAWLPLSVVSSALVAAGRVRALLYMHGAAAMAAAIGLALGIGGGLAAATASMATLAVCNMVICLALLRRSLGLEAGDTVRPLGQALALAMAACAAALLVRSQLPMAGITSALLLCAASGVGALVCLSVAARIMRHALWDEVHRRGQG